MEVLHIISFKSKAKKLTFFSIIKHTGSMLAQVKINRSRQDDSMTDLTLNLAEKLISSHSHVLQGVKSVPSVRGAWWLFSTIHPTPHVKDVTRPHRTHTFVFATGWWELIIAPNFAWPCYAILMGDPRSPPPPPLNAMIRSIWCCCRQKQRAF